MQFTEHNPFGDPFGELLPRRAAGLTKFTVFFNKQVAIGALGGGGIYKELTAAEAEKVHRKFEAKGVKIYAPLLQYEAVEVEAESAEGACAAVVHLLGAPYAEGELTVVATSSLEKKVGV